MTKPKLSVLVVFGGESSEHEVSLKSAKNIFDALNRDRYDVSLCHVAKDGRRWTLVDSFDDFNGPELLPVLGGQIFMYDGHELDVDVMFPVLHGKHGEDGEVQGLAKLMHIPVVGPSVTGAAVSMDKDLTKHLLRDAGIPVVDWVAWHVHESRPIYADLSNSLGTELFLKPANAGSSVGVSKVGSAKEFDAALNTAALHDDIVLIERAVTGREIELAVLGNGNPKLATPGEVVPEASFYSYEAKYASISSARTQIPAELDATTIQTLKQYAITAYESIRGRGMARIDFFVTDDNKIFLNEINSIPGFTDISMYPKMWEYEEMTNEALVDRLIELALE